jgi:hypothetical protein
MYPDLQLSHRVLPVSKVAKAGVPQNKPAAATSAAGRIGKPSLMVAITLSRIDLFAMSALPPKADIGRDVRDLLIETDITRFARNSGQIRRTAAPHPSSGLGAVLLRRTGRPRMPEPTGDCA